MVFGVYWITQVPHFIEIEDTVNAAFAALAMPLFIYFAYHEYLSYKWNENLLPLRFLAGASFVAGMLYFIITTIDELQILRFDLSSKHDTTLRFNPSHNIQDEYIPETDSPNELNNLHLLKIAF